MPETTDLSAIARSLGLPSDASETDIRRQASGLVASITQLRKKVYVGIIDPILRANGVEL
jgi:hypothetical protein